MNKKFANILEEKPNELNKMLENQHLHSSFQEEKTVFREVISGNKKVIDSLFEGSNFNIGKTTDSELQTAKYAFVSLFALIIRLLMEEGLPDFIAYNFNDQMVRKIDGFKSINEISSLKEDLYRIVNFSKIQKERMTKNPYVNQAINYIVNNTHKKINRKNVAEACGVSESYLSTLFVKTINQSLTDSINEAKIAEAKRLIKMEKLKTIELAYMLGYSSESYFCKIFKDFTKMTVEEFKNSISSTFQENELY